MFVKHKPKRLCFAIKGKENNMKEKKEKVKPFKVHKIDDILKAGGADAYAEKHGLKGWDREISGKIDFTNEEWEEVLKMLENDK
jgi:hypothetical protein